MKKATAKIAPQARKEGLVVQELHDEVLVYDLRTNQAHCLNKTAALVWKHSDGKTTAAEMASILRKEIGSPVDAQVVLLALDRLGRANLMDQQSSSERLDRVSRREVLRKIGWAAAVSLPLVTSITAPTAASAATCIPESQCGPATCGTPCHTTGATDCTKVCRPRADKLENCSSQSAWQCVGIPAGTSPCPCP